VIEPDVCERAVAHGLVEAVIVDLRHGPWRGRLPELIPELIRRSRAWSGGGLRVEIMAVRTLDEAAELVDQMGRRLLNGELVVVICSDEILADVVERHGEIYAQHGAH
jgi:hypothetical protein